MSKISMSQRTKTYMQDIGWEIDKVEYWNTFARKRKDLYGFGDFLAFCDEGTVIVQCSDHTSHSKRRNKILALDIARKWIRRSDRHIWIITWRPKEVGRKKIWIARVEIITEADFENHLGQVGGCVGLQPEAERGSENGGTEAGGDGQGDEEACDNRHRVG